MTKLKYNRAQAKRTRKPRFRTKVVVTKDTPSNYRASQGKGRRRVL